MHRFGRLQTYRGRAEKAHPFFLSSFNIIVLRRPLAISRNNDLTIQQEGYYLGGRYNILLGSVALDPAGRWKMSTSQH